LLVLAISHVATAQAWSLQDQNLKGELRATSCTSSTACVAVGTTPNDSNAATTFAETWGAGAWSAKETESVGVELNGVSCTSVNACTAVGHANGSLAERWNGTTWTIQSTPNPAGWKSVSLSGVSCPTATACTAVGYYVNSSGVTETLAESWNGTTWTIQATPNVAGKERSQLNGVSCTSATSCIAVGYSSTGSTKSALAESWNGTAWTIQTTPTEALELNGVSCTSATACTAVGGQRAVRWNGTTWTIQAVPTPVGAVRFSLLGVSCATATSCTAVGFSEKSSVWSALAETWNGTAWSVQETSSPGSALNVLFGVSCTSASVCTAVGTYNLSSSSKTLVGVM
jgi:hypothetical protein